MPAKSLIKYMGPFLMMFTLMLRAEDSPGTGEVTEGSGIWQPAARHLASRGSERKRNRTEVNARFGYSTFPDNSPINHFVAGGGPRFYLTRRFSVEPEVLYMRGPGFDRDLALNLNCSMHFRPGSRMRPYLIGGVGMLHHRSRIRFAPQETFSGNGLSFGGGVGFKIALSDRVFVAPEVRVGWNPFLMITSSVGYSF